jgi:hypothetical protein
LSFFLAPSKFFGGLQARPTWIRAYLLSTAITIATVVTAVPLVRYIALRQAPAGFSSTGRDLFDAVITKGQYITVLVVPVTQLLRLSVSAYVVWALCVLVGADPNFRKVLAVISHCSIVDAADRLFGVSLNYLTDWQNISDVTALRMTLLSARAYVDTRGQPILRVLLDYLGLFSIWYLILLVVGVSVVLPVTRTKAALVAGVFWLLGALISVGNAMLAPG